MPKGDLPVHGQARGHWLRVVAGRKPVSHTQAKAGPSPGLFVSPTHRPHR